MSEKSQKFSNFVKIYLKIFVKISKFYFQNAKMFISLIYYVMRMVGLTIFMILQIPKQLLHGFYTGLLDTGVIKQSHGVGQLLENLPSNLGIRQIFLDSIVELFHTSDLSEDDHPTVTGMPTNRHVQNAGTDSSGQSLY